MSGTWCNTACPCRSATIPAVRLCNSSRSLSSGAASGYSRLLPGWCCSGDVPGSSRSLSGRFCDIHGGMWGTWLAVLSDCVGDNAVYHYDSCYGDCTGYGHCDDPDDYDDYHGSHCSLRDFDDFDGCSDNSDCEGDVTADVSSFDGYLGHDVIRIDVIRPQTDSSAALWVLLEREPPGLRLGGGGGGGWGDCRRFHSWYRVSGDYYRDVGGGADVCGRPSFDVGRFVSVGAPDVLWGRNALKLAWDLVRSKASQAVRWQKRLYDPRVVNRIFTFGDWTVQHCPPAVVLQSEINQATPPPPLPKTQPGAYFLSPQQADLTADLMDTIAQLRNEIYALKLAPPVPPTPTTWTPPARPMLAAFTTTKVLKFSGSTSWDQYRQVFDAIVRSNRWDDATVALQLCPTLRETRWMWLSWCQKQHESRGSAWSEHSLTIMAFLDA